MKNCTLQVPENPILAGAYIQDALLEDEIKVIHAIPECKINDLENYWTECAKRIGTLVPMEEDTIGNKNGNYFTHIKYPWHERSDSFSHSNTRQPLHTDGSYESNAPNVTFFFCHKKPLYGGSTTYVMLKDLKIYIENYDAKLLQKLITTQVTHKKGDDFKVRPILCNDKLTWNYFRCDENPLRQEFHDFLEQYVVGGGLCHSIKLKQGEALFFKDEEVLHGRNSFLGERWLVKGGINV